MVTWGRFASVLMTLLRRFFHIRMLMLFGRGLRVSYVVVHKVSLWWWWWWLSCGRRGAERHVGSRWSNYLVWSKSKKKLLKVQMAARSRSKVLENCESRKVLSIITVLLPSFSWLGKEKGYSRGERMYSACGIRFEFPSVLGLSYCCSWNLFSQELRHHVRDLCTYTSVLWHVLALRMWNSFFVFLSLCCLLSCRVLCALLCGYSRSRCLVYWLGLGYICDTADISELNLAKTTSITFPNGKDNLLSFEITIRPDEGYYQWVQEIFFSSPHVFELQCGYWLLLYFFWHVFFQELLDSGRTACWKPFRCSWHLETVCLNVTLWKCHPESSWNLDKVFGIYLSQSSGSCVCICSTFMSASFRGFSSLIRWSFWIAEEVLLCSVSQSRRCTLMRLLRWSARQR